MHLRPANEVAEPRGRRLRPPRADAATLLSCYVWVLLVIPPSMVLRGVPMSLGPASVVGLFLALFWMCAQLTSTLGAAKGPNVVRTALFVYAVALLATYGVATYGYLPPDELAMTDHAMVLAAVYLGVVLGMCDGVRGRDRLDFVLRSVVAAATVVAAVGALQFVLAIDLAPYLEQIPGLRGQFGYAFIEDRNALRRVGATTGHPIEFGVLCALTLPLAVHYALRAREEGRSGRWWLCVVLIGSGVPFSVSRSAIVGLAGAAIVLLIGWSGRRRSRALLIGGGMAAVLAVVYPGLARTIYGLFANIGTDSSTKYRVHDYELVAGQTGTQLWLGRGLGTWYAPKHQILDNQYLGTLIETGIIGVVAYLVVFGAAIYAALRARAMCTDPQHRDLGLSLAASLAVPLIGSATFDLLAFRSAAGLAFLLVGAAGAYLRIARSERWQPAAVAVPVRVMAPAAR